MTALDVLREASRRGVELAVNGRRLHVDAPQGVMTPDLLEALRCHKAELLPLVPERASHAVDYAAAYAAGTAGYGTREDLRACEWAEQHGHPQVIPTLAALERDAREADYRHAVGQLVHLFETVRAAYRAAHEPDAAAPQPPPTAPAWRVVIDDMQPLAGPIRLDACTTITSVPLCIERTLIDLERAVAHRNVGRASAYTDLIDEYLARLRTCGVTVRVEVVQ